MRSKTWVALVSPVLRFSAGRFLSAASSGTLRHSQEGTLFSSKLFSFAGTPALRKYFCARTSQATCDHPAGTSISSSWKTTEPSGLRISLDVVRNSIPS